MKLSIEEEKCWGREKGGDRRSNDDDDDDDQGIMGMIMYDGEYDDECDHEFYHKEWWWQRGGGCIMCRVGCK